MPNFSAQSSAELSAYLQTFNAKTKSRGRDYYINGQFEIDDKRPVAEIATLLKTQGFDPIWKDWDPAILAHS